MKDDKKKIKNILAGNIRKSRARIRLTQEQASEKADITLKYWQRLEMISQVDLPSLSTLLKIAKALEVKMHELLLE